MARSETAAGRIARTSRAKAKAAPLQAEAWSAWLLAASVSVFLTANPLYLATACLVGLVVYASLPAKRRRGAYGFIVKIGLFFAVLSVPFNVLTGSSGSTTLVELPRLTFPNWLGGVTFGGDATLEAADCTLRAARCGSSRCCCSRRRSTWASTTIACCDWCRGRSDSSASS